MEARDELALGFREIEGQPACFRNSCNQKKDEPPELWNYKPELALCFDYVGQTE